ncbi:23S rRNA (adenine(2503)-C(2))-methyltransferase RlmN [Alkaliphilus sp. B6464]|nr:23S rRNA (adenine(2503)-C(2))-methyltransferase RlmN [Alkaliphilus sp. B6464]QUH21686.1 23S rRNA (adenine(2503)-C(2))-methyltransferase RlmN [Alkaliphilus sp. B6464]
MMEKKDLLSLTLTEIEELLVSMNEKKFRGKQIFQWINKGIKNFDEMTNLSKALRDKLEEHTYITNIKIEEKLVSSIDGTIKYLFLLDDYNIIEGVVMQYNHGLTACISTQVGCAMGCSFCASTLEGLVRNLRAGEMIDQILTMQNDIGDRISNIVLMGSGEPLNNFDETINFLSIINNENGLNIGNRHITLSTSGLVPQIKALADLQIPINLAISLHAPNDELRRKTMPVAKKYSIKELIASCRYYIDKTSRRITFEYALIKGVNDGQKDANELSTLLKGMLCHVNLIPVNSVEERGYKKPSIETIKSFQQVLKKSGIEATVRREMGSDINAACGQLRRKHLQNQQK